MGHAAVVMDQIGTSQSDLDLSVETGNTFTSQRFESTMNSFDIGAIDDFTVNASQLNVTQVQAVFQGFSNLGPFTGFNNVSNWAVEIYTSVSAAAGNLNGFRRADLAPGVVTLNTGYAPGLANSALVTLPVNLVLPSAGTYWIGVIATMPSTNGQVGVHNSLYAAGFPNGLNGMLVNPNGGFQMTNNQQASDPPSNFAYRVTAVPEPASMAALALGAAALIRRRRKA